MKTSISPTEPLRVEDLEVVIDPGHGGEDGGTSGHGIQERDATLAISKILAEELKKRGFRVAMTRETDVRLSLEERASFANEKPRLCMISVHLNQSPSPKAHGVEIYFAQPKKPGTIRAIRASIDAKPGERLTIERDKMFAEILQKSIIATTGARDRGARNEAELAVLNMCVCPAALVECGFVSHAGEAAKLKTSDYQKKIATGLADGVAKFLELAKADPKLGLKLENTQPGGNAPVAGN